MTHILKLVDNMCKYQMDLASIVEDTEQTYFCPQQIYGAYHSPSEWKVLGNSIHHSLPLNYFNNLKELSHIKNFIWNESAWSMLCPQHYFFTLGSPLMDLMVNWPWRTSVGKTIQINLIWSESTRWLGSYSFCKVQGEWVIRFNGLSRDRGQRGPYSPYKSCNHSLYIGIIIFTHIDNTQSTGHK